MASELRCVSVNQNLSGVGRLHIECVRLINRVEGSTDRLTLATIYFQSLENTGITLTIFSGPGVGHSFVSTASSAVVNLTTGRPHERIGQVSNVESLIGTAGAENGCLVVGSRRVLDANVLIQHAVAEQSVHVDSVLVITARQVG